MKDTAFAFALVIAVGILIAGIWNLISAHLEEKRWRRQRHDEVTAAIIRQHRYGEKGKQ